MAERRERAQEEQHKVERGVARRVCQVLLPEDRSRQGEPSRLLSLSTFLTRPFYLDRALLPRDLIRAACLETSLRHKYENSNEEGKRYLKEDMIFKRAWK